MSKLTDVGQQRAAMDTIVDITSVFEGIASMRIAQTKNQVQQSQQFFSELWHIYNQLSVGRLFEHGHTHTAHSIDKQLFIIVTSESGFSGDIDQRLVQAMLKVYNPDKQNIIVIGKHGATQLVQAGVAFERYFTLPARDRNINVQPIIQEVKRYKSTVAFYTTYVSLMVQEVRSIDLISAVKQQAQASMPKADIISESNYIFEPSTYEVAAHLEGSMMQIALSQVILDSKLAQYASRFRAMYAAKDRAHTLQSNLTIQYNRVKRSIQDERLKEIINGLQRARI